MMFMKNCFIIACTKHFFFTSEKIKESLKKEKIEQKAYDVPNILKNELYDEPKNTMKQNL